METDSNCQAIARPRLWWPALGLACLVASVFLARYSRHELIDDAFIVFRYAENLLSGHGWVFNPGERIEGYTSFLWLVAMAGGGSLGLDYELVARLVGGFCALLCVVFVGLFWTQGARQPRWSTLLAPWLLALHPTFAAWAVHGLESSVFALWLLLAVRADLRSLPSGRIGHGWFWFALAALTRPEGVVLFAVALGHRLLSDRQDGSWRRHLVAASGFALVVGSHVLFRLAYYGELLPHTFYVKVGAKAAVVWRGMVYVGEFFSLPGGLIFLLVIPAIFLAVRDVAVRHLLLVTGALLTVVAVEGGDVFFGHRFLMPAVPLLLLLVQEGVAWLFHQAQGLASVQRRTALAALAVVALVGVVAHGRASAAAAADLVAEDDDFVASRRQAGLALRRAFPPETTVALNPVGVLPFVTGFPTIDMMGLVDRHIGRAEVPRFGEGPAGHEKGDGLYVLSRRPDLILFGNVLILEAGRQPGSVDLSPAGRSEYQILHHVDFKRLYTLDALRLDDGRQLLFARRRDFTRGKVSGAS